MLFRSVSCMDDLARLHDCGIKGAIIGKALYEKKISLPRIKTGKMLQKRKENPTLEDSKGNFNYSEKSLDPEDFMALEHLL